MMSLYMLAFRKCLRAERTGERHRGSLEDYAEVEGDHKPVVSDGCMESLHDSARGSGWDFCPTCGAFLHEVTARV